MLRSLIKRLPHALGRGVRAYHYCANAELERRDLPELNDFPDEFVKKWGQSTRQITKDRWDRDYLVFLRVSTVIQWGLLLFMVLWVISDIVQLQRTAIINQVMLGVLLIYFPIRLVHYRFERGSERTHLAFARSRLASELATGRLAYCIECAYDLRATPGSACPECGATTLLPNNMESDTNGPQ